MSNKKRQRTFSSEEESEMINRQEMSEEPDISEGKSGGTAAGGPGYRGAFIGETMENQSFNERHKEQLHITTRNLITRDITWLSRGFTHNPQSFKSQVYAQSNYYEDDSLRSEPINMYAPLFADQKLLGLLSTNNKAGYNKCKLNAIRFTLTFSSYRGSWVEDGFDSALYADNITLKFRPVEWGEEKKFHTINTLQQQPLPHYVYRDRYDEYSSATTPQSNILPTPLNQTATGNTSNIKEYRTKKFLENEVNGLTLVHNGESFHFERKVNAKGAYYITAGTVQNLFSTPTVFSGAVYDPSTTTNIQTIINELEGITPLPSIIQQLGEGYNLLVVPAAMTYLPVKETGTENYSVQPALKTQIHIKCEADWFLYDYSYGEDPPLRNIEMFPTTINGIYDDETAKNIQEYFKNLSEKKTKAKRLNRKHKQSDTVFRDQRENTALEGWSDL